MGKREISPEHYFFLQDGTVIKSLHDLKESLKKIDDTTFMHHVNATKNDFASWIEHVIKDKKLAYDISKLKDKRDIIDALEEKTKKIIWPEFKKRKTELKKIVPEEKPKEEIKEIQMSEDVSEKLKEILQREKEIEKREQKIEEIESRIEKKLSGKESPIKFFSKEFIQGLVIGALISLIIGLIYVKFLT